MSLERAHLLIQQQEDREAVALLEPLAAAGSIEAKALLGMLLSLGSPSVTPDGARAEALLLEAAAGGYGAAAHNLATLYAIGCPGFEPKRELCQQYLQLARDLGFQVAPDAFYQ